MKRRVTVNTRRGPGLVGTMAKTAVIAGTATVAVGATRSIMGGGSSKKAAAEQDAAEDQQMADLQAQQTELAAQQQALAEQQQAAHATGRRRADPRQPGLPGRRRFRSST